MTKNRPRKNPREIALDIIMDITENKDNNSRFSHIVINNTLKEHDYLEKQDRAFITRICEGSLERIITIDYIINQYSKLKVKKMKPLIRSLLRISVYQIKYMDRSPDFAICNEAVKIAKKRGFKNLSGFINGILRNIIRSPEKVIFPDEQKNRDLYLSVKYSAPQWMVKQFIKQYDYPTAKAMLEDSLKEKPTSIRCNLNKTSIENLKTQLKDKGVKVADGSYLPYALKISQYDSIDQLETFQKGYFSVQDESSMLVSEIAKPDIEAKAALVVDTCAAPGGKSTHIAEKLDKIGQILSRDLSNKKVDLIAENAHRLGLKNLITQVFDATKLDESIIDKADIVIADVPCSGLGVIAKKPDIKYNMSENQQKELVILQRRILETVHKYVKPGGTLIYSTCTVNKDENIGNVEWFLEHFQFKLESIDQFLHDKLKSETTKEGYLTLLPGVHESDGFFIARLKREPN